MSQKTHAFFSLLVVALTLVLAPVDCFAEDRGLVPIAEIFSPNPDRYPAQLWVKVAAVSYNPTEDAPVGVSQAVVNQYKARVRTELTARIRDAADEGAELVVTPEFGLVGYPDIPGVPNEDDQFRNRGEIAPYLETVPGPSTSYFGGLAHELGIWLVIGLAERDQARNYNTTVVFNPQGEVVTKYRKINLYKTESDYLDEGAQAVTFDTDLFGRASLIICSDVYSSFPASTLNRRNVDVTLLSTSWAKWNSGWKYFSKYAGKSKAYFVGANQNYFPDTGVLNPNGSTQSHIRQTPATAYGFVPRKSTIEQH